MASASTDRAGLQSLLMNIIDYAGLFPPAKLDMATTVRNYARYLESDEQWMLGRLIVPVARLEEFEREAATLLPRTDDADPWQISALTAPAADRHVFQNDIGLITQFNERHGSSTGGLAEIDAIEFKAERAEDIEGALDLIPGELFPYIEVPIDRDPRGLIAALADGDSAAKVRTGGITAEAYPAPDHLARFISACALAQVPFKATAGLHHPVRHFSEIVKAKEFGFLNVFVAACFAFDGSTEPASIQRILDDDDSDSFSLSDTHLAWGSQRMELSKVEAAREQFAVSFGSCSFEEPIDDLKSLNLL